MASGKVETYIGFCIRSGKITRGSGAIETLKGGVYLIIADKNCAKNSKRLAMKFRRRFSCPLMIIDGFERAVNKENCKIAAIRDMSLAAAIIGCADVEHEIIEDFE